LEFFRGNRLLSGMKIADLVILTNFRKWSYPKVCMFTKPDSNQARTRKQSAEAIHHAMTRFPLIVEVLGQLREAEIPFPGDEDIRHGCQRAITAIMVELARIEPAPPGKSTKAEAGALSLIQDRETIRLIDADQLQRMEQFIQRILGTHSSHH
jgi:hypothetical protein